MYKTLHHIKLIGETFWREVVDRQARRGAYEMTEYASNGGIVEIRPAEGSYVQVDFTVPSSYQGEPEDYTCKAYLVEGNLLGLIGVTEPSITFAEGEESKTLSLPGGYVKVGGHLVTIRVNRVGNDSKMNYQFNFGSTVEGRAYPPAYSAMATAPMYDYDNYDDLSYNYMHTNDAYRTLTSITITRTARAGSTPYPELTIAAPAIIHIGAELPDLLLPGANPSSGVVREIVWNGADTQKRLKVNASCLHWVMLEPDEDGKYPSTEVRVMGDVNQTFNSLWEKLREMISGKVDKVTGKGLSTNDYTTAEKQKLAGVEAGANAYTLPNASSTTVGGVKVHADTVVGQNGSPLQTAVNSGRLYALAPYADVDMAGLFMPGEGFEQVYVGLDGQEDQKVDGQFDVAKMGGATASAAGKAGMVPQPAAGDQMKYLRGDGTWDDIRPALLSPYPVKASALDSMNMLATGAQAGASDAAVGVPPYQLRLKITAASASTAVITVKSYVESIMGGTGTTYTVDLTKANGGQAVNQNTIVDIWDGNRMTIGNAEAYLSEAIVQKDSYIVVTCDVAEVGMYYRQGLTNALTALENRIAALENA